MIHDPDPPDIHSLLVLTSNNQPTAWQILRKLRMVILICNQNSHYVS